MFWVFYRLAKAYVEKYEGRLSRSHGYQEAGAKVRCYMEFDWLKL